MDVSDGADDSSMSAEGNDTSPTNMASEKLEASIDDDKDKGNTEAAVPCLECPVCLQPCIHPVQLPCSHIFCFLCVKGVANRSKRCALCRQEIPLSYFHNPKLVRQEDLLQHAAFEDGYQWFYEGRNGWWQYDLRTSTELEEKYKRDEKTFELLIAGFLYVIDLDSMLQYRRNDPTRRRRIKRDLENIPEKKGVAGLRTKTIAPSDRQGAYGVETSDATGKGQPGTAGDGRGDQSGTSTGQSPVLPPASVPAPTNSPGVSIQGLSSMMGDLNINHAGDDRSISPVPRRAPSGTHSDNAGPVRPDRWPSRSSGQPSRPNGKISRSSSLPARPDGQTSGSNGQPSRPDGQTSGSNGQPSRPDGQTSGSNGQPSRPDGQTSGSNGQPSRPDGQTSGSNGQPSRPDGHTSGSSVQSSRPAGQTSGSNGQPSRPAGHTSGSNGQPSRPDRHTVRSNGQPAIPYGQFSGPNGQPSGPSGQIGTSISQPGEPDGHHSIIDGQPLSLDGLSQSARQTCPHLQQSDRQSRPQEVAPLPTMPGQDAPPLPARSRNQSFPLESRPGQNGMPSQRRHQTPPRQANEGCGDPCGTALPRARRSQSSPHVRHFPPTSHEAGASLSDSAVSQSDRDPNPRETRKAPSGQRNR
ncbi:E3 ubiquitin-protein ligase rnf146-like isoform X2 [Liolophura sinensis]|uniref:E3 ubiquitin-protein ligase rnf146-like isoform X2 n=1 Tax=Liolophura sinensis TaxID=3198878 RepID=UPI00315863AE